jgi:hypothetical protein
VEVSGFARQICATRPAKMGLNRTEIVMSFVEGISTAGVDVADPTFAICITALVLIVVGIVALPALTAAVTLIRAEGLMRFFAQLLRRFHH